MSDYNNCKLFNASNLCLSTEIRYRGTHLVEAHTCKIQCFYSKESSFRFKGEYVSLFRVKDYRVFKQEIALDAKKGMK